MVPRQLPDSADEEEDREEDHGHWGLGEIESIFLERIGLALAVRVAFDQRIARMYQVAGQDLSR